ncbi:MAG: diguanylate cyclase [Aquabacterium sp.]
MADLVDRTIAKGFPLLMFPKELEERFLSEGEAKRFLMMVLAGLGAVGVFAGMIIADYLMTPEVLPTAMVLRWAVFPPAVVTGLYILRRLRMPRVNEWLIAIAGVVAAGLQAAILVSHPTGWSAARIVEFNIIIVYTCAIARFWPAVVGGVAVAAIHAYLATLLPDGTGIIPFNATLLMITTAVFTLYGNYKLEHDERMAFLLDAREQALNAELSLAHERLTRMATTDTLTNVANRRYFEDFVAECWTRAQAQQRVLSLIIVDIDYFKPYNDRYGHQAGDRCLIEVAKALKGCIRRPNDLVARWGGEEFVVVLMDADVDAAAAAAERIRHAVAQMAMPHEGSLCARHVTVSGGRASIRPGTNMVASQLLEMADEALYRAKAAGRNRIYAGYDRSVGASTGKAPLSPTMANTASLFKASNSSEWAA